MSFEHHAPLFHSLVSSSGITERDDSRSNTPADHEDGRTSVPDSSPMRSDNGAPAKVRIMAVAKKSPATPIKPAVTSPSVLLSTSNVFPNVTTAGQFVQYVTLSPNSTLRREDGDVAAGQQKFIFQPVIVPSAQAMVLPGKSSPLIFPTFVRMNPSTSASSPFMNDH